MYAVPVFARAKMDWQGDTNWMWDSVYGWAPCGARSGTWVHGGYEMNGLPWKYQEPHGYQPYQWQVQNEVPTSSAPVEVKSPLEPSVVQLRPASSLVFSECPDEEDVRPQLPSGLLDDDEEDFQVKTKRDRLDMRPQRLRHPMAPNQVQHPTLQAQFGMAQAHPLPSAISQQVPYSRPAQVEAGSAKKQAKATMQVSALARLWRPDVSTPTGPPVEVSPGITVGQVDVWGMACTRAEWRIEDIREKLQASMGRPLVSPPFSARGLPNLRLMVFPDAREAAKGVRQRERKGLYATMVKKGPVHASLKLKADCLRDATVLRFHLTVGTVRCGPFTYDYAECAVHGCEDFNIDWLKEIDEASESLRVGVEILDVVDPADCPLELFVLPSNGSHRMCRDEFSLIRGALAPEKDGVRSRGPDLESEEHFRPFVHTVP
ncbi:unnamed protein product [Durusdinium trenchii]|uniref:Uncharacterized protein n=3 Tax=Durusdinium trenchii TaxID=1381693 RepID=A0ABP0MT76_9DINO